MKREDFREITEKHIESIKELIDLGGKCIDIECSDCPFGSYNSTLSIENCVDFYSDENKVGDEYDEKLLQSAKEFLKLFEGDFK